MEKIVIISDTHRGEHQVKLPQGDILIHCGDYDIYNMSHLIWLNKWFNSLDFKHIIFIGGNHDFLFQSLPNPQEYFDKAIYLHNRGIEIEGIKFWGSPHTPTFGNWAFMYPRCSVDAKNLWNQIPENLDFLITHGPPYQILDVNREGEHCGCEVLQREVFKKKPKYHVFGHIHPSITDNKKVVNNTTFINASLLNESYDMIYKPVEINYE